MRARILFATGLVTAVLGACSKPPAETGLELDDQLDASLELALAGATQQVEEPVAVASAIEAPRPAPPVRRPPKTPVVAPPKEDVVPVAEPEPEPETAQTPAAAEPAFTLAPMPTNDADVEPEGTVARTGPSAGSAGGEGDRAGDGAGRAPGRGPGIIIRGGVSERDPCAIHMPGRGGVGVLINERMPRIGNGVGNPTFPGSGGAPRIGGGGFRGNR